MSLKKRIVSALTITGLLAANAITLAGSATAGDWGPRRYHGYGYAPVYGYHAPVRRYAAPHGYHVPPPVHRRRDRTGEVVAGAVLGIGALIVGAAIADAARQERQRHYDRYED